MTPRTRPPGPSCPGLWNFSIADSLPRNMFPANLVEATFKQVSESMGGGGEGRGSRQEGRQQG